MYSSVENDSIELLINSEYPDKMKNSVIKTAPIPTKFVRMLYCAPKLILVWNAQTNNTEIILRISRPYNLFYTCIITLI